MLVLKCDRCGKELGTKDNRYMITVNKTGSKVAMKNIVCLDLCLDCYSDFAKHYGKESKINEIRGNIS